MSIGQRMAALKETADTKKQDIIIGLYAEYVASSVMRHLDADHEVEVVYLKRTRQQGWPGKFMPAVGDQAAKLLHDKGAELDFDPAASKAASQVLAEHGYGNPLVPTWQQKVLGFVFKPPAIVAAEVIQIQQGMIPEQTDFVRAA